MNAKNKQDGESSELAEAAEPMKEMVRDVLNRTQPRHTIYPKQRGELSVGMMGWEQKSSDSAPKLSFGKLCVSLQKGFATSPPDVVLCSGARVKLPRSVKLQQKKGARVLQEIGGAIFKSAGCPVIFESTAMHGAWLIALADRLVLFRYRQHVFGKIGAARYGFFTLGEWAAGLGTMAVDNGGKVTNLLLAICNEVRMFEPGKSPSSSLVGIALRGTPAPKVMKADWILLHSAHRSYMRSQDRGYGIAHPTDQKQTSLLAELTMQKTFSDGTKPPLAALHVNNYYGTPKTLRDDSRKALILYTAGVRGQRLVRYHGKNGPVRYVRTVMTVKLP